MQQPIQLIVESSAVGQTPQPPPVLDKKKKNVLAAVIIIWAITLIIVAVLVWISPRHAVGYLGSGTNLTYVNHTVNSILANCTHGLPPC